MAFLINNLEIIVTVGGGLLTGGLMFVLKSGGGENDLTKLYIKHKKHNESINKSSKTLF